jgi:hypothetical protein
VKIKEKGKMFYNVSPIIKLATKIGVAKNIILKNGKRLPQKYPWLKYEIYFLQKNLGRGVLRRSGSSLICDGQDCR